METPSYGLGGADLGECMSIHTAFALQPRTLKSKQGQRHDLMISRVGDAVCGTRVLPCKGPGALGSCAPVTGEG